MQANAEALERYAAAIDATPPADLADRVLSRLAREPRRTPPRRLVAALASLSPTRVRDAFARNIDAAAGRLATPAVVRAQAVALVAVLALSVGALGTTGALVIRATFDRAPGPSVAAPAVTPTREESPRPASTVRPTPATRPPPAARSAPSPTTQDDGIVEPSQGSMGGDRKTPRPGTPTAPVPSPPRPADPTTGVGGTERPVRTPRPHPTPKADRTPKPDRTPKADRTPKPHPTPEADRTHKPRPTPRADRTQRPRPTARRGSKPGRPDAPDEG